MNEREAKESATFGLALCQFAIRLDSASKYRDRLFKEGTRILDRCRYAPLVDDIVAILSEQAVKKNPVWTWYVNIALLNFQKTAADALLRSLPLRLTKDERLRDTLVLSVLKGEYLREIPIDESCISIVANSVLKGQIKFGFATDQREATKFAKRHLATTAVKKRRKAAPR